MLFFSGDSWQQSSVATSTWKKHTQTQTQEGVGRSANKAYAPLNNKQSHTVHNVSELQHTRKSSLINLFVQTAGDQ